MSDATPSRPVPQRKMKDGIVEGAPVDAETPAEAAPADAPRTMKVQIGVDGLGRPIIVERALPTARIPEVGSYNSRGAQVAQAFVTPKAILRVDLK